MDGLILDPEDEYLRDECCVITSKGHSYVYLSGSRGSLARSLLAHPVGLHVDHINGNTFDNRKSNLRAVTREENMRNIGKQKRTTSGFKGVYKNGAGWVARIKTKGNPSTNLGTFTTPEEANLARLTYEANLWGISPRRLSDFRAAGLA